MSREMKAFIGSLLDDNGYDFLCGYANMSVVLMFARFARMRMWQCGTKIQSMCTYVVVSDEVDLSDMSGDEIEAAIAAFGYSLADFETWEGDAAEAMIAECYLEDYLFRDSCVFAAFNSFEATKNFIDKYVAEHKLPK